MAHDDGYQKALERIAKAKRIGATVLDLSDLSLLSVPEQVTELKALTELWLNDNQLTVLPNELGALSLLRHLWLHNNLLTALPNALGDLKRLQDVFLHGNPALGIPPEVLGPACQEVFGGSSHPAEPAEILTYYFAMRRETELG